MTESFPLPGSAEEKARFRELQAKLPGIYQRIANDRNAPHTTIVVPSLSLDTAELAKVPGVMHYEERMLPMLMLLKRPRTRIVFLSSARIHPIISQYYLNFLTGVPFGHAMRRLAMMDCGDISPKPLTKKILDSPWLIDRIKKMIGDQEKAHLVVFTTTPLERTLAVRLGLPVYGTDPDLLHLGNKTGCRRILAESGIPIPKGFEDLWSTETVVDALDRLWIEDDGIKRAVVKLNEGFSGKGNAMFDYRPLAEYRGADEGMRKSALEKALYDMKFEADDEDWPSFERQFRKMGGIVETFIEGEKKLSPSVQARVNAIGVPQVISTHDQIMGGPTGQMFMGCTFPARGEYRMKLQEDGLAVATVLAEKGVLGRFAIDFIVVPDGKGGYDRYAIEINLRKGGTTHPFLMMKFLVEGGYDQSQGVYKSETEEEKYYLALDSVLDSKYVGMGPEDLIDMAVFNELHYNSLHQHGVVFHMMGALSQFGKLGITCIADTPKECTELHQRTIDLLNREATEEGRRDRLEYYLRAPVTPFI